MPSRLPFVPIAPPPSLPSRRAWPPFPRVSSRPSMAALSPSRPSLAAPVSVRSHAWLRPSPPRSRRALPWPPLPPCFVAAVFGRSCFSPQPCLAASIAPFPRRAPPWPLLPPCFVAAIDGRPVPVAAVHGRTLPPSPRVRHLHPHPLLRLPLHLLRLLLHHPAQQGPPVRRGLDPRDGRAEVLSPYPRPHHLLRRRHPLPIRPRPHRHPPPRPLLPFRPLPLRRNHHRSQPRRLHRRHLAPPVPVAAIHGCLLHPLRPSRPSRSQVWLPSVPVAAVFGCPFLPLCRGIRGGPHHPPLPRRPVPRR